MWVFQPWKITPAGKVVLLKSFHTLRLDYSGIHAAYNPYTQQITEALVAEPKTKTKRKRRRKAAPKKPKLLKAQNPDPGMPKKRTSMWLGEDLLKASAAEAKRLGVSRALWVQITLRTALGLPAVQVVPATAKVPQTSVFG